MDERQLQVTRLLDYVAALSRAAVLGDADRAAGIDAREPVQVQRMLNIADYVAGEVFDDYLEHLRTIDAVYTAAYRSSKSVE